ncbi:hypothetical protein EJB05_09700 [Eragrostis curvula]|uniref:F-box domain-containing protein n=1 Tax=Eragrostis curvula TaxID=38414 RepID=A0A5J9W5M0_9POAL|nr:hypothetical protein EJB05_09700 [Eragrostis curvula]
MSAVVAPPRVRSRLPPPPQLAWGRPVLPRRVLRPPQDLVTDTGGEFSSSIVSTEGLVSDVDEESEFEFTRIVPKEEGLVFVPAPDSAAAALGTGRRKLTSFVRDGAGILLGEARPLVARDGLLLVRLLPHPCEKKTVLRLCVCDLLTGRRDLLPPLDGAGLIEDEVGDTPSSPLRTMAPACTDRRMATPYSSSTDLQGYLVRFSSDSAASQTWSWSRIPGTLSGPFGSCVAAVTRGAAHWLVIGTGHDGNNSMQILHVSIYAGHVGVTEIPFHALPGLTPPDWSNTWLCTSIVDGRLSFYYLDNNQLRIWNRQDGTEVWQLTQAIQLGTELGLSGTESSLSTVCIGEKSSTMLMINYQDPGNPCVIHLRSRSPAMVAGWESSFNFVPAVPVEMNWYYLLLGTSSVKSGMSDVIPAAAAARCVQDLPEDAVVEILARVPDVVSLFRCTIVCRLWRRLVSDPAFLRRRSWPAGGPCSLVGFFVHPQDLVSDVDEESEFKLTITRMFPTEEGLVFVPAPDSAAAALGTGRRKLTSFVRDGAGIPLDEARPLVARDGLLLVRLLPRPCEKKTVLRLCVCNLLTGKWDLLPPLDGAGLIEDGVSGYAVLTAADHGAGVHRPADGYSSFFQVLLAGICRTDLQGYLVRFSSDSAASQTWSWSRIPGSFSGPYGSYVAAVTRGAAHWLIIGTGLDGNNSMQILDVSIDTGRVGVAEIPFHALPGLTKPDWSNTWLCPSIVDGSLSFYYLDNNQLRIWNRQDGTEVWQLTQAIQLGTEL